MTRDSGSGRNGEDSRSEAECEAPQSGPAKTGHRPTSGATQEIINRLKELSDKATPGEWRDDRGDILDSDGVLFEGIGLRDHDAALAVDAVNFVRSTLTNLTPSGVERIRAEAFEEAARVVDERVAYCGKAMDLPGHTHEDRRVWEQRRNEARVSAAAIRALALPSEPPSQAVRPLLDHLAHVMSCLLHGAVESPDYTKEDLGKLPRWMTDVQDMLIKVRTALAAQPSQGDVEGRARELLPDALNAAYRQGYKDGFVDAQPEPPEDERDIHRLIDTGALSDGWGNFIAYEGGALIARIERERTALASKEDGRP